MSVFREQCRRTETAVDLSSPISSVVPSLDGAVLAVLARSAQPLTASEIARLVDASYNGVVAVVTRMADHGIVEARRHGRTTVYVANRAHVAWPAIALLADLRGTVLDRIATHVAAWPAEVLGHVGAVVLHGSFARADGDAASDVDVLVVLDDDVDEDAASAALLALAQDIEAMTGNRADVLRVSPHALAERLAEHAGFRRALREEGIVVHGALPSVTRPVSEGASR